MRWIPFVIFCYLAAAFQVGRLGLLASSGAVPRPEYLILLAVFYAMYAADDSATLVGLICGILLDLLSSQVVGTLAIPLALVCFAILKVRLSVFREHGISQCIITGLAVMVFACLAAFFRWILVQTVKAEPSGLVSWSYLAGMGANALYTGLLAPVVFWLFFRLDGFIGFGLRGPRGRNH